MQGRGPNWVILILPRSHHSDDIIVGSIARPMRGDLWLGDPLILALSRTLPLDSKHNSWCASMGLR